MQKTAKPEATLLYRVTIKSTGITIYQVQGTSSKYNVTLGRHGTVSSCIDEHGESCKAWQYRHTCKHSQAVEARETERKHEDEASKEVMPLNGNKGFSLLR